MIIQFPTEQNSQIDTMIENYLQIEIHNNYEYCFYSDVKIVKYIDKKYSNHIIFDIKTDSPGYEKLNKEFQLEVIEFITKLINCTDYFAK